MKISSISLIDEWQNCGRCKLCVSQGQRTPLKPHGPYWRAVAYLGADPPPLEAVQAALGGVARSVHYRTRRGGYVMLVVYFGRELPENAKELVQDALRKVAGAD